MPLHSSDADSLFARGLERSRAGDGAGAAELFRQASDRGHAQAAYALGLLLHERRQFAEAETQYRRAVVATAPVVNAQLAVQLGTVLAMQGKLDEAEELLRQAVAGGITEAINNVGLVRWQRGDTAQAETLFRQAAATGDNKAMFNLGRLLKHLDRLDEAELALRQAEAAGNSEAATELRQLVATQQANALLTSRRRGALVGGFFGAFKAVGAGAGAAVVLVVPELIGIALPDNPLSPHDWLAALKANLTLYVATALVGAVLGLLYGVVLGLVDIFGWRRKPKPGKKKRAARPRGEAQTSGRSTSLSAPYLHI